MYIKRREFIVAAGTAAFALMPPAHASSKGAQKMYGLIGKMVAVSGQRDALIAVLLEGVANMPGCLSYIVAKDPADANTIWITEVWESEQSHRASLSLPSVKQAITRGRPLIASFGDATITEPIGGHGLRSTKTQ
jgi:quinol monooxygenase YgiN